MNQKAVAAEQALSETYEGTLGLKQLCVALDSKGAQRLADEKAEKRGLRSGVPGEGPVSLAYGFAGRELTGLARTCNETLGNTSELIDGAKAHAAKLREIAQDRNVPILKRTGSFGQLAGELEIALTDIRQQGELIKTIRRASERLTDNVPKASGKKLTPGQRTALAEAETRLLGDSRFLSELADSLSAERKRLSVSFEPLSPAIAPFEHWRAFWLWWVGAVAIDFVQLGALCWIGLAYVSRRKGRGR